tara:strand:- start:981 stop:1355 length:375 start_codon:yes stop_codon:yes gene_type:complete
MNEFNLKKALAGEKVVANNGDEVTQLTLMDVGGIDNLVGVYKGQVLRWYTSGVSVIGCGHVDLHLKMAPTMGEGFLYVFEDGSTNFTGGKSKGFENHIMSFDLSKYPIGFGLSYTDKGSQEDCL